MLCLYFVLGFLAALIERTAQLAIVGSFCFEGDCYIRLQYAGRSWSDAQEMCSPYNSTLPIVDNPGHKRSVEAAVHYSHPTGAHTCIWLGANASYYGSGNCLWLDGGKYSVGE